MKLLAATWLLRAGLEAWTRWLSLMPCQLSGPV